MSTWPWVVLLVAACSCSARPTASSHPRRAIRSLRAPEVLALSDEWLGREVVVDIYEPLYDDDASTSAPPGGYSVDLADAGPATLGLVLSEVQQGAHPVGPNGLVPPLRARGILQRKAGTASRAAQPHRTLVVHEISELSFPEPILVPDARVILRHPRRWHGRYVSLEGHWSSGFESSFLDGLWLSDYPNVIIRCEPEHELEMPEGGLRVGVVGFVYTQGAYGHGGVATAMLQATEITFLDVPNCRAAR